MTTNFTHIATGWGGGEPVYHLHESLEAAVENSRFDFDGDDWVVYEIKAVRRGVTRTLHQIAMEAIERFEPGQLIKAIKWTREEFQLDHCVMSGLKETKDAVEEAIKIRALNQWKRGV